MLKEDYYKMKNYNQKFQSRFPPLVSKRKPRRKDGLFPFLKFLWEVFLGDISAEFIFAILPLYYGRKFRETQKMSDNRKN